MHPPWIITRHVCRVGEYIKQILLVTVALRVTRRGEVVVEHFVGYIVGDTSSSVRYPVIHKINVQDGSDTTCLATISEWCGKCFPSGIVGYL